MKLAHVLMAASIGCGALLVGGSGGVRSAEGCSGAANCTPTAWESLGWSGPSEGIPTDGYVRLGMYPSYSSCWGTGGGGGSSAVTLEVTAPDGTVVPGAPSVLPPPTSLQAVSVTWKPSAPFQPSTTYTLRAVGLHGGGVSTQTFTTSAVAFSSPKPLLVDSKVSVNWSPAGATIGCEVKQIGAGGCGQVGAGWSSSASAQQAPHFTFETHPQLDTTDLALQMYSHLEMAVTLDGVEVAFEKDPYSSYYYVVPGGSKGTLCAVARVTNEIDTTVTSSAPWCVDLATLTLPPPVSSCDDMSKLLETCKGGPSSTAALSPNAHQVYADACTSGGGAGAAGAAGASGGGTAGSLGAGAAGGSAVAGTGGANAGAAGHGGTAAGAGGLNAGAGGLGGKTPGAGGAAGQGGSATDAGAGGLAGQGNTAAGAAGAGPTPGAPGAGGNGTPSAAAASDEGCSVTAVGAPRGALAGAALFLAGLLSTRFRARRGADGSARR